MSLYISILQAGHSAGRGLHDETLRAVGALVVLLGPRFSGFVVALWPALIAAMAADICPEVCATGFNVFRDLGAALGTAILPYADQAQEVALQLAHDTEAGELRHLGVACLGHLVLACGGMLPNLQKVLGEIRSLASAATTAAGGMAKVVKHWQCKSNGKGFCKGRTKGVMQRALDEWLQRRQLSDAVLEAYANVVLGLRKTSSLSELKGDVSTILDFVTVRIVPPTAEEKTLLLALQIVGTIALEEAGYVATFCWSDQAGIVSKLVSCGSGCSDLEARDLATAIAKLLE
eukprot:gnl/TRDRNA2_/TRDRNA2_141505_c2_seq1.p1 gnl/TRDRNA2_/TRDRNA2_141505_c2~~gnl/TRDRNA2_/TRDRNA2_141505_c2_seq1.p1  ORF type:complete len:290 (-),score=51.71 gnl/TRDRNA2_/TRDRNA2_141505_c2_seq1:121-990(-)